MRLPHLFSALAATAIATDVAAGAALETPAASDRLPNVPMEERFSGKDLFWAGFGGGALAGLTQYALTQRIGYRTVVAGTVAGLGGGLLADAFDKQKDARRGEALHRFSRDEEMEIP